MGKRLTCPRCGASNKCDVPANGVTATLRPVPCRACGHRFNYGFKPEYVTEAEPEPHQERSPEEPYDSSVEAVIAKERLTRHVMQHREYHDRDRDVLLLHLLDMADHLDNELAAIKRVLDVLTKRGR
jgi:hypothetical protein